MKAAVKLFPLRIKNHEKISNNAQRSGEACPCTHTLVSYLEKKMEGKKASHAVIDSNQRHECAVPGNGKCIPQEARVGMTSLTPSSPLGDMQRKGNPQRRAMCYDPVR